MSLYVGEELEDAISSEKRKRGEGIRLQCQRNGRGEEESAAGGGEGGGGGEVGARSYGGTPKRPRRSAESVRGQLPVLMLATSRHHSTEGLEHKIMPL